jgi:hypothetical protein
MEKQARPASAAAVSTIDIARGSAHSRKSRNPYFGGIYASNKPSSFAACNGEDVRTTAAIAYRLGSF